MTRNEPTQLLIVVAAAVLAIPVIGRMFPYGFPLFSLALLGYLGVFLATGRTLRVPVILPFYLLVSLFLVSMVFTKGFHARPYQDLVEAVGAVILLVLLHSTLRSPMDWMGFQRAFAGILWCAGVLVALVGLYKLHMLSQGVILDRFVASDGTYRAGTSLPRDYNFYAFGQIAALLAGAWFAARARWRYRLVYLLTVPVFMASVALSGSRRGVVVLGAVLVVGAVLLAWKGGEAALRSAMSRRPADVLRLARVLVVVAVVAAGVAWVSARALAGITLSDVTVVMDRLRTLQNLTDVTSSRTDLWAYAFERLSGYGPREVLLGAGFDYLPAFADRFSPDVEEFTPHNMLLAAFLSGGVLTLGTLVWLMGSAVGAYLRRGRELVLFAGLTALAVPFAVTSLHLLFSFPFFLILLVLPRLADRAGGAGGRAGGDGPDGVRRSAGLRWAPEAG